MLPRSVALRPLITQGLPFIEKRSFSLMRLKISVRNDSSAEHFLCGKKFSPQVIWHLPVEKVPAFINFISEIIWQDNQITCVEKMHFPVQINNAKIHLHGK